MIRSVGRPPLEDLAWSSHNAPPVALLRRLRGGAIAVPDRGAAQVHDECATGTRPWRGHQARERSVWFVATSDGERVALTAFLSYAVLAGGNAVCSGSATVSLRRCGVPACDSR
jgi:hypothetical protein